MLAESAPTDLHTKFLLIALILNSAHSMEMFVIQMERFKWGLEKWKGVQREYVTN